MKLFNEIYELTYLPILTPNNLLDNLKLDNYNSILFKKNDTGIIAEISCTVDKENVTFYYEFDKSNYLNEAYYYEHKEKIYLFNRNELLNSFKKEFCKTPKVI
ncbi:hypothetical protein EXM65_10330 [Clostridium botulinum]|uniref:Uncharacterized protein n=1 Tax=Clostridium botulinum TaxID=1491 RepID=A0A6M0SNU5_CLOBO|nr:hypothetical protein [Clostridium botulinum]